ncbi:MAG TPA: FecR domain-containing protein [Stellaceae bacterium]|nr:FecR domain-containing protein [Stellaceae bacterium]
MRGFSLRLLQLAAVAAGGLLGAGGMAQAQQVGISSAVNPQAEGTPPGATARPLIIGQDVVFNERIATTAKGQTQLLFVDQSSMSIGPNSDLTIDRFVYDPKSGTGRLAMSATRGLLRYVGGRLSKHDGAVTLRTSTATLAVRGGAFIVDISAGGKTDVIFIYGNGLTIAGVNGAVETLTRPGYQVTITPTGAISSPQAVSSAVLGQLTGELDGEPGQTGGASVVPTDATVAQQTGALNQTLAQTLQNIVNSTLNPQPNANPTTFQSNFNQQPNVLGVVCNGNNQCSLIFGGSNPAFSSQLPPPAPPAPPQPPTTTVYYGGQVKGTGDPTTGFSTLGQPTSPGDPNGTVPYSGGTLTYADGALQSGIFSGTFGNFGAIAFPLPLCATSSSSGCTTSFGSSGTSSAFGAFSGTTYMSADDSFFYATLTPANDPSVRLFVFGGAPVDPSVYQPTGSTRIFAFTVQPDAALQSTIPFVRAEAGGNLPNASVSPLYIVAPPTTAIGDASTEAAARALQASLAISGQGANQQSVIAVTTGTIDTLQSSGQPLLAGQLRGSSMTSASGTPTTLDSGVSTTVDGNGNTFYGGNAISGFVLDQTQYNPVAGSGVLSASGTGALTGAAAGSAATETALSGATTSYGFAQAALPTAVPSGVGANRTTQALSGYFGGLMYTNAQPTTPYILTGNAQISTDAVGNRVQATLSGAAQSPAAGVTAITMNFGGLTGDAGSREAFIDNNTFAALESASTPQQITIDETTSNPSGQLFLVSSGATTNPATGQSAVAALLPNGTLCQCQYLQWGYWGGSLTTADNETGSPRIDAGNINTWVAGSMTPLADMQSLETQGASFTYTGAALGSVFNNGASYLAGGGFTGTYNFGTQSGSFAISNFDGHNFAVSGAAPLSGATYSFSGTANGFSGSVNGAFYGPQAAETGGNFAFHSVVPGINYLASGTFAGTGASTGRP